MFLDETIDLIPKPTPKVAWKKYHRHTDHADHHYGMAAKYDRRAENAKDGDKARHRDKARAHRKIGKAHHNAAEGHYKKYLGEVSMNSTLNNDNLSEEQLDELSKKTLGSYINKASQDSANKAHNLGRKREASDEVDRFTNRHMGPDKYKFSDEIRARLGASNKDQDDLSTKIHKRLGGIKRATKKLTEDNEMTLFETSANRDFIAFKSLVEARLVELADNAIHEETEAAAQELFNGEGA